MGYKASTKERSTSVLKNYKEINFDKILNFDSKVFPVEEPRANFLKKSFEVGQAFISVKN